MRLRCFIAMAFDHNDTDNLYNSAIKRVLRDEGIKSIRVDRVEHQERIDQFIIDNIDKADFAIADLTYARPSVYYEAGYADREIPVIYTCRRDHFGAGTKTTDGDHLKVHFDLMTKNIIGWSHPSDSAFVKRLRKRVRFVSQPLLRDREAGEERRKQIEQFKARPLSARLEAIADNLRQTIRSSGFEHLDRRSFRELAQETDDGHYLNYKGTVLERLMTPVFSIENRHVEDVARCVHKKTLTMIFATVVPRLTPADLRGFRNSVISPPAYDLTPGGKQLERIIERYIICSVARLDIESAMHQLHQFSRQENLLTWTTTEKVPAQRPSGFQESYSGRYGTYFFVRRRQNAAPVFRVVELDGDWGKGRKRPLQLREIPRTLALSLIGGISRTQDVNENVSLAITAHV